jgi:putative ABC transport system permease protein
MVSTEMASKNSLKVGSTFTAYGATLTVAGIFNSGTQGGNDVIIVSLPALERLSGQGSVVSDATATVDSADNLSGAVIAVKNVLGSSADITSSQEEADNTVKPLENVKSISLTSLIGAVIAGAVIIFLVMLMIVRERRREIGILKAIGASNLKVVWQFMAEAVTFTLLAAVVGIIIGIFASGPVTNTLVTNASSSSNSSNQGGPGGGPFTQRFDTAGGGGVSVGGPARSFTRGRGLGAVRSNITNVHAAVGWTIIIYGLAASVVIALIGSTLSSYLIAKVRPAEVMRAE